MAGYDERRRIVAQSVSNRPRGTGPLYLPRDLAVSDRRPERYFPSFLQHAAFETGQSGVVNWDIELRAPTCEILIQLSTDRLQAVSVSADDPRGKAFSKVEHELVFVANVPGQAAEAQFARGGIDAANGSFK